MENIMKKIKSLVRNLFIWSFYLLGIIFIYRNFIIKDKPLVRVLCFHDVSDEKWFRDVISKLSRKYNILSPDDFFEKRWSQKKINVLLTFDDGYGSWSKVVVPVLSEFRVKGLFFTCSGLLEVAENEAALRDFMANRLLVSAKEPLTWEGLSQILRAGNSIGGHTINHLNLAKLDTGDCEIEVGDDKAVLANMLKVEINDFAYPFGNKDHFTNEVREVVLKKGYKRIYTAVSGFFRGDFEAVPRTLVDNSLSPKMVELWVEGGYDIFSYLK